MDGMESDSEGSNIYLEGDLVLEMQESSSSSWFKHQYPDDPVFVLDEALKREDDMAFFASICTLNTKPALVKNVLQCFLISHAAAK